MYFLWYLIFIDFMYWLSMGFLVGGFGWNFEKCFINGVDFWMKVVDIKVIGIFVFDGIKFLFKCRCFF